MGAGWPRTVGDPLASASRLQACCHPQPPLPFGLAEEERREIFRGLVQSLTKARSSVLNPARGLLTTSRRSKRAKKWEVAFGARVGGGPCSPRASGSLGLSPLRGVHVPAQCAAGQEDGKRPPGPSRVKGTTRVPGSRFRVQKKKPKCMREFLTWVTKCFLLNPYLPASSFGQTAADPNSSVIQQDSVSQALKRHVAVRGPGPARPGCVLHLLFEALRAARCPRLLFLLSLMTGFAQILERASV